MVYKRYIKKGKKLYGPYSYQSKKKNGKVISQYLGKGVGVKKISSVNKKATIKLKNQKLKQTRKKKFLKSKLKKNSKLKNRKLKQTRKKKFLKSKKNRKLKQKGTRKIFSKPKTLLGFPTHPLLSSRRRKPLEDDVLRKRKVLTYFFAIVVFLVAAVFALNVTLTGKATLSIENVYLPGEAIDGNLNLVLKQGELLPESTRMIMSWGEISYEYALNELIDEDLTQGDFYIEGKSISGDGSGYGIIGKKIIYPNVSFNFILQDADEGTVSRTKEPEVIKGKEEPANETIPEEVVNETASEEDKQKNETKGETEEAGQKQNKTESEEPGEEVEAVEEGEAVSGGQELETAEQGAETEAKEKLKNIKVEQALAKVVYDAVTKEEAKEAKREAISEKEAAKEQAKEEVEATATDETAGSLITGEVVSEAEQETQVQVSKNLPYIYELPKGKTIKILSSSEEIKLQIKNNIAIVTTEYSEERYGFGEDYLNDTKLKIVVGLSQLNLFAEQGELRVSLIYDETELVSAAQKIKVEEEAIEKNITEKNVTKKKIKEKELTIAEANASVETLQYDAVINQPVKWKKNIKLDQAASVRVEIPKQAENITVYKIVELYKQELEISEENETGTEEESINEIILNGTEEITNKTIIIGRDENSTSEGIINETQTNKTIINETGNLTIEKVKKEVMLPNKQVKITGEVISGKISAEIELEKERSFMDFFKRIFSFMTGRVVSIQETSESKEVVIGENATEFEIEYQTPGPVSIEETTLEGKRITIIADELNYTNILAYSSINAKILNRESNIIRLFWDATYQDAVDYGYLDENRLNKLNKSSGYFRVEINFSTYDLNYDGFIDYVGWIVPHLSNQSYELIIEIINAEHLDENRNFISDIYDEVKVKDDNWSEVIGDYEYVRIVFEDFLDSTKHISFYARAVNYTKENQASTVEVYFKNGNEVIASIDNIGEENWYRTSLENISENQTFNTFDLRILLPKKNKGGVEFDYIADPSPSNKKFVIVDSSGNNVASVDDKGNMRIKGSVIQNQTTLNPTPNSFVIQNFSSDTVSYVNESGYLFLLGNVMINSNLTGLTNSNLEFRNNSNDLVAFFDNQGNLNLKGKLSENYAAP